MSRSLDLWERSESAIDSLPSKPARVCAHYLPAVTRRSLSLRTDRSFCYAPLSVNKFFLRSARVQREAHSPGYVCGREVNWVQDISRSKNCPVFRSLRPFLNLLSVRSNPLFQASLFDCIVFSSQFQDSYSLERRGNGLNRKSRLGSDRKFVFKILPTVHSLQAVFFVNSLRTFLVPAVWDFDGLLLFCFLIQVSNYSRHFGSDFLVRNNRMNRQLTVYSIRVVLGLTSPNDQKSPFISQRRLSLCFSRTSVFRWISWTDLNNKQVS